MIDNVPDLRPLVETGDADALTLTVDVPIGKDTLTADYSALHVRRGHLLIWNEAALPVVGGRTCTTQFMDLQLQKFPGLLGRPLQPTAALRDAIFVGGNGNYFHFLANYFPMFAFLSHSTAKGHCTVAIRNGVPASVIGTLGEMLPALSGGRAVEMSTLEPGVYAVENVIFPTIAPTELACVAARRWLIPFILERRQREHGPLKIFIRREGSTGRNLTNQEEVEKWFAARGYTAVNPGALSFEDQVILFARASHIAGVEGAAFTNLLFALHVRQILMIASPALRGERSMAKLVRRCPTMFHTLYGNTVSGPQGGRNADYHLPLSALEQVDPAILGA